MKQTNAKNTGNLSLPTTQQLKEELHREQYKSRYRGALRGTVWTLVVVAAAAILCATFFLSVLKIQGTSMEPVFQKGEMVLALKTADFKSGDIIAFYYNNQVLLKRAIGAPGDWIDIDEEGTVYVNGEKLDEPYILEKSRGDGDVEFPFQVPDGRWFVLGDHRSTSSDSRSSIIGTVSGEQIVGKVILRFWPLSALSFISRS